MSTEIEITKVPATGIAWFNLSRHDDPEPSDPEPAPEPADDPADPEPEPDPADDPADPEPEPEPEGADKLGDAGKKALDRMKAEKAEARKAAAAEKKRADDLARQVEEFKDRDRTESEKLAAKAERAAQREAKATARAVAAEVRAAAGEFADPTDAVDVLMRDPSQYVDADGEIDMDAIGTALSDLLERKPHWARPEPAAPAPEKKPQPKPDPGQGSRGAPAPVNYLEASKDEVAQELAKYGYRQRV
jgi:hypothetical protein